MPIPTVSKTQNVSGVVIRDIWHVHVVIPVATRYPLPNLAIRNHGYVCETDLYSVEPSTQLYSSAGQRRNHSCHSMLTRVSN